MEFCLMLGVWTTSRLWVWEFSRRTTLDSSSFLVLITEILQRQCQPWPRAGEKNFRPTRYKKDKRVGENYGRIKNKAKMKENKFLVEELLLSQLKLHHLFFHHLCFYILLLHLHLLLKSLWSYFQTISVYGRAFMCCLLSKTWFEW